MMHMRKLIALDMDGTLYNDQKEITPRTKSALLRAQERGCILCLASGRPVSGLKRPAKFLEMNRYHGLLMGYNGGRVLDFTTGETVCESAIPISIAKELLGHIEGFPVTPIVDDGTYIYTNTPHGFQIEYESGTNALIIKEVENVCAAVNFSPAKILIAAPERVLSLAAPAIAAPFEGTLSFVKSAPFYLEATPLGVNKAGTMENLCNRIGIEREDIIAFGDAENDLSMIRFAGTGVAMANAVDALKAEADMVTGNNNEDGIADALERLGI